MKKVVWTLLTLLLLVMAPHFVSAENPATTHVFDDANLLSEMHIEELEVLAEKYGKKWEVDFLFFTREDPNVFIGDYMDDYYDEHKPGYEGPKGSVVMVGIDMVGRDITLHGFGEAEDMLDPDRLTAIREEITGDLSRGNYFEAFSDVIYMADRYMKYRPGVDPDNPFYKTSTQFFVALILGAIVVGAMLFRMNPRMTTNASTYQNSERTNILGKHDRYIRTTVTKRKKPQNKSGGSSGGGSSGRTSGGSSRSSSSGKF